MLLTLLSDNAIRLEPAGHALTVESPSPDQQFSPFHMMAAALAHCSLSILFTWSQQTGLRFDDLVIEVAWTFAEQPSRVGAYYVRFSWPSLPEKRLDAATRVIEACTIHATLQNPPRITIEGTTTATPRPAVVGPPGISPRSS
jgi:Predicted redox protein, regulator of disulfide bond formation